MTNLKHTNYRYDFVHKFNSLSIFIPFYGIIRNKVVGKSDGALERFKANSGALNTMESYSRASVRFVFQLQRLAGFSTLYNFSTRPFQLAINKQWPCLRSAGEGQTRLPKPLYSLQIPFIL